jgi:large subunit ribosomal protein L29
MKISELRGKTVDQLTSLLLDLKKEAFNLRFQKVNGELEKTSRVRVVRRTIARVKTLMNEMVRKEIKEASNA